MRLIAFSPAVAASSMISRAHRISTAVKERDTFGFVVGGSVLEGCCRHGGGECAGRQFEVFERAGVVRGGQFQERGSDVQATERDQLGLEWPGEAEASGRRLDHVLTGRQ